MPRKNVQLPGDAVDDKGNELSGPITDLLENLNILADPDQLKEASKPRAAFKGPPESVALIESGATAIAKWWAAGIGATVAGVWAGIISFWNNQGDESQRVILWSAAIVSAALLISLGLILSSDLRGRALASVATLQARRGIAEAMIEATKDIAKTAKPEFVSDVTPLPNTPSVTYSTKPANEESGWTAIAMWAHSDASKTRYLLVKGASQEWATATEVEFV